MQFITYMTASMIPQARLQPMAAASNCEALRERYASSEYRAEYATKGSFAATPAAAFAGAAPNTRRAGRQACSFQFTKGCNVPHL
jgi:hypothetical protein